MVVASRRACLLGLGSLWLAGCATGPASVGGAHAEGWQDLRFPGKRATRYQAQEEAGRQVWHAQADSSASMLRKRLHRPAGVPVMLDFSWRVEHLNPEARTGVAGQDDAVASVVVAFDGDHRLLPARDQMVFDLAELVTGERPPFASLIYVWGEEGAQLESVVPSARTQRIRKIIVDAGAQHLGQWRHHRRDVLADFRRAFAEEPGPITALGLMTDADNTQAQAEAWYGDIVLSP